MAFCGRGRPRARRRRFVFGANPTASGVAHNIAITAAGAPALSASQPVTVEVR